jgi:DNA-binding MarR family transcriptional regulator
MNGSDPADFDPASSDPGDFDPADTEQQLLAIHRFVELVVASSRSPRQRERMNKAAGLPLTVAGNSLLRSIARHGPIALSDLAVRMDLDQSTVSRQVQALEISGLIERSPDPADRRSSLIAMSAEGAELLGRTREVARSDYDAALADWTDSDRTTFAALLDRFHAALVNAEVDDRGWSKPRSTTR